MHHLCLLFSLQQGDWDLQMTCLSTIDEEKHQLLIKDGTDLMSAVFCIRSAIMCLHCVTLCNITPHS